MYAQFYRDEVRTMINIDKLIIGFDGALRTLLTPAQTLRSVPGSELPEAELTDIEKRLSCALMRVNHVGEVCAQALYQGQGLTARNEAVQQTLMQAAREETEHLAWTERRIAELGGRKLTQPTLVWWIVCHWRCGWNAGR